jgi:hypothetical protein
MLAGQYSVVASHWITCQFKDLVRRLSRAVTAEGHGHIWCILLRLALEVKSNVARHAPFMTFRAAASLLPVARPEPEVTPQERAQASSFTIEEAVLSACHQLSSSLLTPLP